MGFFEKFHERAAERSGFCLGIDPSAKILAHWGCEDTPQGLQEFCKKLLERLPDVALVKPQSAYFERFGAAGVEVLQKFIQDLRARGILVLLDVKRGDICETNKAYAAAYFGESGFNVDAITTLPFMGFATLKPFLEKADEEGGYVFVVTASSNPEGAYLQEAKLSKPDEDKGKMIKKQIAEKIRDVNKKSLICGAVIGARADGRTDEKMRDNLSKALILTPGIGAQGGSYKWLKGRYNPRNIIPTSARDVLMAKDFEDELEAQSKVAKEFRDGK